MLIEQHISEYRHKINEGLDNIDVDTFKRIIDILVNLHHSGSKFFVAGNGGSSAISEHLTCDHTKGVSTNTNLSPKFFNLTSNVSLITAIGNDLGYENIFSEQLNYYATSGDALIVISSSGNSPNIIKALKKAKDIGMITIALTGFSGGQAREIADLNLHIPISNYGVCEDCHQIIMHMLAQCISRNYSTVDPSKLIM